MEEARKEANDMGKQLIIIMLDAKSAFDVVVHNNMMRRLYHLGIQDNHWSLIQNLHNNATASVKRNGYFSNRYNIQPEALKSLYRSLVIKRTNWSYAKTMSCSGSHLGIPINIKNTKFVKDLPKIDAQFRFNQCNSFREEYISLFSPYGPVLIL
jgi:hypothetical protein